MLTRKAGLGLAAILLTGCVMAFAVKLEADREYRHARNHYVEAMHARALSGAAKIDKSIREIYENLRTLSQLPSLRKLDREATNLDGDGRSTLQQVYNNLANAVAVSEVYITPVGFDPGRLDPLTGELQRPSLMFDQLIVDAGHYAKSSDPFAARASDSEAHSSVPEVETYEYEQLVEQLAWLKQNYPDRASFDGLNLPMISGQEVITCDNTEFVKTMHDADRRGMIFSVPFYGVDGRLKGVVSAIIRSNALRTLLPGGDYALANGTTGLVLAGSVTGQAAKSQQWVGAGMADPGLVYSESLPLAANDPRSSWYLWAGHPDTMLSASPEAVASRYFRNSGYAIVALLTLVACAMWTMLLRNLALQKEAHAVLEQRVAERTAEIHHMALHDALTGLPNRNLLRRKLQEALARVGQGATIALLWVDVDHFKQVNDSLGHQVGDLLLNAVSERMRSCVTQPDTVARVGGDEFIILQAACERPQQAADLARKLIDSLSQPVDIDGHHVMVGASIGIALASDASIEAEELLRNADIALYRAKLDGRGGFRHFESGMDEEVKERRKFEMDLRAALAGDQFELHYQPLVDATSEAIVGFEALLRWRHPERGLVQPATFIPVAEEIGIIGPIGEWVLQRACLDAATWPRHLRVAVNLSPVQFKSAALGAAIVKALDVSGLLASRLELEVTESVLLNATDLVLSLLHDLRRMGVRIAMDDFGTGYSSLSYLRSFPFDKIKIDRSFIAGEGNTAIVKAIVAIGVSLGISTTAEGVETPEQLRLMREHGCNELQGFYFSKPLPLADVRRLLVQRAIVAA